jgi:hypothetical protein
MRSVNRIVVIAALIAGASGCIYGSRDVVRDEPIARTVPPPPPPPGDEADAPPPPGPEQPGGDVDAELFRERLSPYGHWEWVPDYGQVWVPAVSTGWRPYWYGHWVLTDWGWTFVSDDPWGWAVYHYGRWGFSPAFGWYWVPGYAWGPAWVTWRVGFGWCSWAPLGPRGVVYGYGSPAWIAVRQEHFTQPIVAHAVINVRQTSGIVQRAQPLPMARPARGAHFGPSVASVSAATGRAIRPVSASSVVGRAPQSGRATSDRSGGGGSRAAPSAAPRSGAPSGGGSAPARGGGAAPARGGGGRGGGGPRAQTGTPRAAPGGSGGYRARMGSADASAPSLGNARPSGGGGRPGNSGAPVARNGGGGGGGPRASAGRPSGGSGSAHHGR